MNSIDYEKFLTDLVKPLVVYPDELVVKVFDDGDENDTIVAQIMVNEEDKGRVIGKNGRVINAIKTIAFATTSRSGKKIEITVDSF